MFSRKFQILCNNLIQEAEKSEMGHKHACAIISGGKVHYVNHNSNRSRIGGLNVPSLHAEAHCLVNNSYRVLQG